MGLLTFGPSVMQDKEQVIHYNEVQFTLVTSNIDISKFTLLSENMIQIHILFLFPFQLLLFQTTDISK